MAVIEHKGWFFEGRLCDVCLCAYYVQGSSTNNEIQRFNQFHSFNDLSLLRNSRQKRTDTRQAHMRKFRQGVILKDAENVSSTKGKEGEGCSVTHVSTAALTRVLTTDAVVSSGARTGDTSLEL